ncbi:hypothetical protein DAEQUDRAFT_764441 [Daedalea quercina L-15889]|uniref:Uncharacterized protein n=1 Tax=Daedalea quercina L-15889 TaxID=1314783 RepID=A0A165RBI3_9APHY|nr:hypothetical protein DAEQUDRAFT_764441 [Daedalea quercina L-15889]
MAPPLSSDNTETFDLNVSSSESDNAPPVAIAVAHPTTSGERPVRPLPGQNVSPADLRKALSTSQRENATLREEVRTLKLEVNSLKARLRNIDKRDLKNQEGELLSKAMAMAAKKYMLLDEPFVQSDTFYYTTRPDVDPTTSSRYDSDEAEQAARAAELFDRVPSGLHPELVQIGADLALLQVNKSRMATTRRNVVSSVVKCANMIFNIPQVVLQRKNPQLHKTWPEVVRLIHQWDRPNEFGDWCPVIFPEGPASDSDPSKEPKWNHIFQSQYLVKVMKVILFGEQALGREHDSLPSQGGKPSIGKALEINYPTDGLIVFTAIVARYILSPDSSFGAYGKTSHINYFASFEAYKQKKVVNFFLQHVFSITPPQEALPDNAAPHDISMTQVLLAINEDTILHDNDNEDGSDDGEPGNGELDPSIFTIQPPLNPPLPSSSQSQQPEGVPVAPAPAGDMLQAMPQVLISATMHGLSIVEQAVGHHGQTGDISVSSGPGSLMSSNMPVLGKKSSTKKKGKGKAPATQAALEPAVGQMVDPVPSGPQERTRRGTRANLRNQPPS